MPEHDPWAGTSGLRDDFDGTITLAKFVYDSEYNDGNTLIARIEIEPDEGGDPEVLKLSTGSGWEADDKGTKAKREDGSDPKGFNKSCNFQRFAAGAMETDFAGTLRKSVPWDASVWEGQNFHFNRKEFPAFDPTAKPTEVTIPTVHNGAASNGKSSSKAPAKAAAGGDAKAKAAAAKAAAAKAKAAAASGGDDDPNLEILKGIAAEADTHDEFIEKAYAALDDADSYESVIVTEEFYDANHG